MKKIAILAAMLFALDAPTAAQAQSNDPLARCLKARTSAADRTTLVRWVYVGLSGSAAVKDLAQVSEVQRAATSRAAGKLLDRLLTRDCRAETLAQMKANPQALQRSFTPLGELAVQDMIRDPAVVAAFSGIVQYVDMSQVMSMLMESGSFGMPGN